jgi:hypothetical protein
MSDELVTIATFETPVEAELARMRLEAEEILCFVHGAHMAGMQVFGLSVGGVHLRVRPEDAELALEILEAPLEETELEVGEDGADEPVPYLDEDD